MKRFLTPFPGLTPFPARQLCHPEPEQFHLWDSPEGDGYYDTEKTNRPCAIKLYKDAIIHGLIHAGLYFSKDKNIPGCPLPSGVNDFEHDNVIKGFNRRFSESKISYKSKIDELPPGMRNYINENYGNYSDYMKNQHPNVDVPKTDYRNIPPDINKAAQVYIVSINL